MDHEQHLLLTLSWAVGLGLGAQLLAHRLRLPAIVLLLLVGVLAGPGVLGWVEPALLGAGLGVLVKLAVAVILFEGALSLRLEDLQSAATEVRGLITTGVVVTWALATLAVRALAGFDWALAILFGALMTVTGPTVVQPLLRRVQVPRRLKAILEGEAILIDPVGAVLAVAAMDVVLGLSGAHPLTWYGALWAYFGRLLTGAVVGVLGGWLLSRGFRRHDWVPLELRNLVALAGVWVVFAIAEGLVPEAGLMAAVAMGLVFQRSEVPEERRLRHFKEQLTVLGISVLFVLLAAELPLEVVRAVGWPAVWTALALALVVRPAAVALATWRSSLDWRDRLFVAWVGPRGIIAASVASLFALALEGAGIGGGRDLLAVVFVTIFVTVTLAGLTAPLAARLLGLTRQVGKLAIIVGAGPLARRVGALLQEHGRQVVLADRNQSLVWAARRAGLEAVLGNALEEDTLASLGADDAETLLAATTNPEVNVLAVAIAREEFHTARAYPVIDAAEKGVRPGLVERIGGRIAFGRPIDIRDWEHALNYEPVAGFAWEAPEGFAGGPVGELAVPDFLLPLVRLRGEEAEIVHAQQTWSRGERVVWLSRRPEEEARAALEGLGPRQEADAEA